MDKPKRQVEDTPEASEQLEDERTVTADQDEDIDEDDVDLDDEDLDDDDEDLDDDEDIDDEPMPARPAT